MGKKLSIVTQSVLRSVEGASTEIVEVETLTESLSWDRGIIVSSLKELENAGYGYFTVGRRGQPSRFTRTWGVTSSHPSVADPTPASPEISDESVGEEQVFILKRSRSIRVSVPIDLTPEEASKLIDWLKVVSA